MTPDDGGQAGVPTRISQAFAEIERERGIRIILAVESGSRAWGFQSRDSDWDVRFLYLRPRDAYLTIAPLRDTIEMPLMGDLDLAGWDVRKALALVVGSNAIVLEWLGSPIIYARDGDACRVIADVGERAGHLPALVYHYDRLARRHWALSRDGRVRLKTLFYALRPALALAWMRENGHSPPMHLAGLMSGVDLPTGLADEIERLRAIKSRCTEADTIELPAIVGMFVAAVLARPAPRPDAWDRAAALAEADAACQRLGTEDTRLSRW